MLKKLLAVAERYRKNGLIKKAKLMDELIKKYAEFGDHFIKEWDDSIERINVVKFDPESTIIEYEDGTRHEVPTLHFLQDLYMGPAKDAPGANLRHHFRDIDLGEFREPKKKEYLN